VQFVHITIATVDCEVDSATARGIPITAARLPPGGMAHNLNAQSPLLRVRAADAVCSEWFANIVSLVPRDDGERITHKPEPSGCSHDGCLMVATPAFTADVLRVAAQGGLRHVRFGTSRLGSVG
jgi:hypothetical protein